jgi:geranylgeranyl diphosphate synthase, type II
MNLLAHYQDVAEKALNNLDFNGEPKGLYEPFKYVIGIGGKRIRPALCLAACHYFSGNGQAALNAAMGIEVFHNFTLLHDDFMDNAPIRRNQPTVHVKWSPNTAILSGDAMMVVASEMMLDVPAHCLVEVQKIFLQTAREVCEGQQFDMDFESTMAVSPEQYLNMIRLKTAVLIAASLKIGAIIGGANEQDADLIYAFGRDLGLAFQLQDDYLDVFGDESSFGKSIGGDIVANKKTFLLINCLEKCNAQQREELEFWLNKTDFDREEKVDAIKSIFLKLGIGELGREKMNFFYHEALQHLSQLSVSDEAKQELTHFAAKLINRDR